ncbi:SAV_6107 family HEPN domain-containing protein [Jatrophihabitans telluris]|uniref:SAV_6107 family HEPN domain-containing protein n=1 Tax=Jatrophihabitans telluris TaxID=2038343 RepID=A0ABY4QW60_9ACTN|nr:SAV_6107 family HEPN domain-containing protein [Jatrophihabitans telluris]UQX87204.1 SAV_6107 family HEPN domain-containing protein [Jatrophihabitans telluris]
MYGPIPASVLALLGQAKTTWAEAVLEPQPAEKYRAAHVAALRAAAALLALRARPTAVVRRRPTSAWVLLDVVAPELSEWSAYFADSAQRRAAIEAGSHSVVNERDADDLLRAAGEFIAIAERMAGQLPIGLAS